MKKLALLLTLCLLAWTMAGCQTQEMPLTQGVQRLRGFRQLHRPRGGSGGDLRGGEL